MDYLLIFIFFIILYIVINSTFSPFGSTNTEDKRIKLLKDDTQHFPFRFLYDENHNLLPIVAITAFFRSPDDEKRYRNYVSNGIKVIGVTAYKTFPKPISDGTGDQGTVDDKFEYLKEIKDWLCCFKSPEHYGFNSSHNIIEMSESDFKDIDLSESSEKKYDFVYSCLEDDKNSCPANGWNYINRNFDLAQKCFPIMIDEFKLKILVIGRLNCGLEEKYKENIEVLGFLPYHEFQEKLKQSKYLFVPNIYDASPRVVTEAISKDIPVLMNRSIVCGSKYINNETGELFTDEHDLRYHLKRLLGRNISPKKWWKEHYGYSSSGVKFKNFLNGIFPDIVGSIKEVHFF